MTDEELIAALDGIVTCGCDEDRASCIATLAAARIRELKVYEPGIKYDAFDGGETEKYRLDVESDVKPGPANFLDADTQGQWRERFGHPNDQWSGVQTTWQGIKE